MIHPVDEYVGKRMRARRITLGLSQEDIGKQTGITFQQVQKYEKGSNRIAISRLYEFSKILLVPTEWFLEGFEEKAVTGTDNTAVLYDKEILVLIRTYLAVPPLVRKCSLKLLKSIANSKEDSENIL